MVGGEEEGQTAVRVRAEGDVVGIFGWQGSSGSVARGGKWLEARRWTRARGGWQVHSTLQGAGSALILRESSDREGSMLLGGSQLFSIVNASVLT